MGQSESHFSLASEEQAPVHTGRRFSQASNASSESQETISKNNFRRDPNARSEAPRYNKCNQVMLNKDVVYSQAVQLNLTSRTTQCPPMEVYLVLRLLNHLKCSRLI